MSESPVVGRIYNAQLITNQSPITNHQSPITNNQSPITNHQSIANYQSSINPQSAILNPQCRTGILLVDARVAGPPCRDHRDLAGAGRAAGSLADSHQ